MDGVGKGERDAKGECSCFKKEDFDGLQIVRQIGERRIRPRRVLNKRMRWSWYTFRSILDPIKKDRHTSKSNLCIDGIISKCRVVIQKVQDSWKTQNARKATLPRDNNKSNSNSKSDDTRRHKPTSQHSLTSRSFPGCFLLSWSLLHLLLRNSR